MSSAYEKSKQREQQRKERYGLSSERAIIISIDLERLSDMNRALEFEQKLDEEQKEMNSITIQRKDMEKILEILYKLDCQFFACDGPDAPLADMKTCHRCYAIQKLRNILNNNG